MTKIKEEEVDENTKLWFGRFKGTKLRDIPTWYANWLRVTGFSYTRYLE